MLLLSFLFTVVSLLLIYALMRDTGRNTPHARNKKTDSNTNAHKQQILNKANRVEDNSEAASLS